MTVEIPLPFLPALVGNLRNLDALSFSRHSVDERGWVPVEFIALARFGGHLVDGEESIVAHVHETVASWDLEHLLISRTLHDYFFAEISSEHGGGICGA